MNCKCDSASLRLVLLAALIGVATVAHADEPETEPEADHLPAQAGLPDPLVLFGGDRVVTPRQWFARRRPQLRALFEHYMYGAAPHPPAAVVATLEREDSHYFGGKATKRELALAFGPPETPKIHLLLVVPNERKGPAPVFLGLNFQGNHTVVADPTIALPTVWTPTAKDHKATDSERGAQADVWSLEAVLDQGYAVATFYCGDVAPDHPGLTDGVFPHYLKPGETKPGRFEWGAVAAWAWGLSRAVDYLVTNPDIDRRRIAVVGHSRLGKAAIVAGAFDDRIALTIPHQAGCGGTAPSRGKVGESVKQINDRFPHWFDDDFKQFNDRPERLPFDQNGLVALIAPRPVLFTNGVEDTWANPEGQFEVLKAADPVYRFLGVEGLGATTMPEVGQLVDSRLGYHIRPGKHSMGRDDWKVWIAFANKHLGR